MELMMDTKFVEQVQSCAQRLLRDYDQIKKLPQLLAEVSLEN
jgi:hypothetical protein